MERYEAGRRNRERHSRGPPEARHSAQRHRFERVYDEILDSVVDLVGGYQPEADGAYEARDASASEDGAQKGCARYEV